MFQKENGGCIPHGKAVLPVPEAGTPLALLGRDQNNLLVKSPNPWYDNMKNLKGCLR